MTASVPLALSPRASDPDGDPQSFAARVVVGSKSSFTHGMRILERPRREAMFAVYAFARTIDDIADGDWENQTKLDLLSDWRQEIDALYEGNPGSLIGRALVEPVKRFDLPRNEFDLMIEGMAMDAEGPIQAPDLDVLQAYTRRVAGTAGMLSIRIFGAPDDAWRDPFALDLADAFQLTNILRDVEEDAGIDRLYLPRELLLRHGVPFETPMEAAGHPDLWKVCADIGEMAQSKFEAARNALAHMQPGPLRPALMMMGVYEGYLRKMADAEWRRHVIPLKMSRPEKLWRGLHYAFLRGYA